MDFSKGKEYCDKLIDGLDENEIASEYGIDIEELYRVVDFTDFNISRKYLKYLCSGYAAYNCFSWPNSDERLCPVSGYELRCPLKKIK